MNTTKIQDTIADTIEEKVKSTKDQLTARVQPHLKEGKRRLEELNERAKSLINEHPAACLLGAVALGYLVARVARRERS